MLLKDFLCEKGFDEEYKIIKEKTNYYLKKFKMRSNVDKVHVEIKPDAYFAGYFNFIEEKVFLSSSFVLKCLKERNINEIVSTIVHEKTHLKTFERSKLLKECYLVGDDEIPQPVEYSFKNTRKFLYDNVDYYSYDYEFGVFWDIWDLKKLSKKQFDKLSLCILKDFLENPDLSKPNIFVQSMDECISFGFESVCNGISNATDYFENFTYENKELFLSYSLYDILDSKRYLFDKINLNKEIIKNIFETYNHKKVVKEAESLLRDKKETIGRRIYKELEKI